MNFPSFNKCLDLSNINTGSIVAAYDFLSGDSSILYNLKHPTGNHYYTGVINSEVFPAISVGLLFPSSGRFSGVNGFRVGYDVSLEDATMMVDFDYNSCERVENSSPKSCLMSNMDTPTGASGFSIAVNQANRLCLSYVKENETVPTTYTHYKELSPKNVLCCTLNANNEISFGLFDFSKNSYDFTRIRADGLKASNKWYIGNYLNGDSNGTGFFGKINNAVLFSGNLGLNSYDECFECLNCTGVTENSPVITSGVSYEITGFSFVQESGTGITGYSYKTVYVKKADGNIVPVVYSSGVYGTVYVNDAVNYQSGQVVYQNTGATEYTVNYDDIRRLSYNQFNLSFNYPLESGDIIEVYTYPKNNPNIDIPVDNLVWRLPSSGNPNLFGNGLLETSGVDYSVSDGKIVGFDPEDHLVQSITSGKTLTSVYSGWWHRSRIWLNSGSGGTPIYYPPTSQYVEVASGSSYGRVLTDEISGIASGYTEHFDYDFYMNGQKLIRYYHYNYEEWPPFFRISLSGERLPDFTADVEYDVSGNVTGISNVQSSELAFYPREGSFYSKTGLITSTTYTFSGLSGFSEEVWINGIKQRKNHDFYKSYSGCQYSTGDFYFGDYPFEFYNNETGYYNVPPVDTIYRLYNNGYIYVNRGALGVQVSSTNTFPTKTTIGVNEGFYFNGSSAETSSPPPNGSYVIAQKDVFIGDVQYFKTPSTYLKVEAVTPL